MLDADNAQAERFSWDELESSPRLGLDPQNQQTGGGRQNG